MCKLGSFYAKEENALMNLEKSVDWYQKAADLGDADGMYHLALCYDDGKGVVQNKVRAAEWYQKAADLGNVGAMYHLALCYNDGEGVARDNVWLWSGIRKQRIWEM